ncbi:MAG: heavy metal-associated domain-containing protein [bacterium]|nr:heavy metal-associated domain-containing protein [bacterium]
MLTKIKLSGLTCPACQKLTQNRIGKIAGVSDVKVDLNSGEVQINADREITKEEVAAALQGTAYQIE